MQLIANAFSSRGILWCLYNHRNCSFVKKHPTPELQIFSPIAKYDISRDTSSSSSFKTDLDSNRCLKPGIYLFFNAQEVLLCKLQKYLKNHKLKKIMFFLFNDECSNCAHTLE